MHVVRHNTIEYSKTVQAYMYIMFPCSQTEPDVPAPGARPDESVVRSVLSCYSGQSRSQHLLYAF